MLKTVSYDQGSYDPKDQLVVDLPHDLFRGYAMHRTCWHQTNMAGLNAQDARIFRITHIKNVAWLLANGLHCMNSKKQDPNFVAIGSAELIQKRAHRTVEVKPHGTLADYIPFYFTPYSIMMYKIKTGHGGTIQQRNTDLVVLTSSIHRLIEFKLPFVFYDGHAYMEQSKPFTKINDLSRIDWPLLQSRDFKYDPEKPEKQRKYQAEALVHQHMPAAALSGIGCYNSAAAEQVEKLVNAQGLKTPVKSLPDWYF